MLWLIRQILIHFYLLLRRTSFFLMLLIGILQTFSLHNAYIPRLPYLIESQCHPNHRSSTSFDVGISHRKQAAAFIQNISSYPLLVGWMYTEILVSQQAEFWCRPLNFLTKGRQIHIAIFLVYEFHIGSSLKYTKVNMICWHWVNVSTLSLTFVWYLEVFVLQKTKRVSPWLALHITRKLEKE